MNATPWISVKDRLPPYREDVLVLFKDGEHGIAYCDTDTRNWHGRDDDHTLAMVRCWMPLPQPPPEPDEFEAWWKSTAKLKVNNIKELAHIAWKAAIASVKRQE